MKQYRSNKKHPTLLTKVVNLLSTERVREAKKKLLVKLLNWHRQYHTTFELYPTFGYDQSVLIIFFCLVRLVCLDILCGFYPIKWIVTIQPKRIMEQKLAIKIRYVAESSLFVAIWWIIKFLVCYHWVEMMWAFFFWLEAKYRIFIQFILLAHWVTMNCALRNIPSNCNSTL